MSSQLSAHVITVITAMTRISVSRCSTLPAHRGSASAEKCSTNFSTDIATLPSLIKGEPAQPVSPSEPPRPFHALPLDVPQHPHRDGWVGAFRPGRGAWRRSRPRCRCEGHVPDRHRVLPRLLIQRGPDRGCPPGLRGAHEGTCGAYACCGGRCR